MVHLANRGRGYYKPQRHTMIHTTYTILTTAILQTPDIDTTIWRERFHTYGKLISQHTEVRFCGIFWRQIPHRQQRNRAETATTPDTKNVIPPIWLTNQRSQKGKETMDTARCERQSGDVIKLGPFFTMTESLDDGSGVDWKRTQELFLSSR